MGAYSIAQVKARLSAILEAVDRGEEVVITKRGKPVARIQPERHGATDIDWAMVDAFREKLRNSAPSVSRTRRQSRF